jgi:hypothetical protein
VCVVQVKPFIEWVWQRAFLLITGSLKMFGKNDWLIKIRYTGSGSKKMKVAAAAAALLSVCLCVRKEKKRRGKNEPALHI